MAKIMNIVNGNIFKGKLISSYLLFYMKNLYTSNFTYLSISFNLKIHILHWLFLMSCVPLHHHCSKMLNNV